MKFSVAAIIFVSNLTGLVAGDAFVVNQKLSKDSQPLWQGCFVDGHDWWFCSKWFTGKWSESRNLVQIGCQYTFQIGPGNSVKVGSTNGCFASHGTLYWNDGRDDRADFETQLTIDSPNC